jgi:cellulose biosynthesis protein BcsQ
MDDPGLYALLQQFHRSNQLPVFVLGAVAGVGIAVLIGSFVVRAFRFKIGGTTSLRNRVDRLQEKADALKSEKERLRNDLRRSEHNMDAARARIGELTGHVKSRNRRIATLTGEFDGFKAVTLSVQDRERRLIKHYLKARRLIEELQARLATLEEFTAREWESPVLATAPSFRPLSERRTPIVTFLNLKGGVGKTTIAANLGVAMALEGLRVLLVDLDYQGSLSQLVLSNAVMQDLLQSRRLVHRALEEPEIGLANFHKAIVRLDPLGQGSIAVVAADEELQDAETVLTQRWHAKTTADDVRYRLRAILHAAEIADQFDLVLLDSPPRLTTACVNALAASDYVLIPVLPNKTSTEAVPRLLRWLKRLCLVMCPELAVMGVIGNKTRFYGDAPVKKQQAELNSLVTLCQDAWGQPIQFFTPLPMHDPAENLLPARDPKYRDAYLTLVHQVNEELPNHARSRSAELFASADPTVGSVQR